MTDDDSTAEILKALPLRILLVEDDEFDFAVFCRAFRQSEIPCEIVRCRCGEDALAGLRDADLPIDVLVADHQLPGMSGFDLCLELLEGEPPFALVLLTGGGSEQMAIRALRAGIQDYIVKDSSQEYLNLLPLVLPRVARRHRARQARRQNLAAKSATELADLAALVQARKGKIWLDGADGATPMLNFAVPLAAGEIDAWKAGEISSFAPEPPPAAGGDSEAARRKPATSPAEAVGEPPRRVLIAHPNPVVAFVASQGAERCGCRFVTVENGRMGISNLLTPRSEFRLCTA